MAKGSFAATAVSTKVIDADEHREYLLIQKVNAHGILLGIGEESDEDDGVHLQNVGDALHIRGASARLAVYAIGNLGEATWQDGDVEYLPGPGAGGK